MLSALQMAVRRTILSNYQGIPTDCPTREKRGWTGDMNAAFTTVLSMHAASKDPNPCLTSRNCQQVLYNFDMQAAYEKWLVDVAQSQAWHNGPEG